VDKTILKYFLGPAGKKENRGALLARAGYLRLLIFLAWGLI
jgi:hypothetical protein